MRYIVNTDEPIFYIDTPQQRNDGSCLFLKGDVVEVNDTTPDEDGDVAATNLTRPTFEGVYSSQKDRYIALSCLTPEADSAETSSRVSIKSKLTVTDAAGDDLVVSALDYPEDGEVIDVSGVYLTVVDVRAILAFAETVERG